MNTKRLQMAHETLKTKSKEVESVQQRVYQAIVDFGDAVISRVMRPNTNVGKVLEAAGCPGGLAKDLQNLIEYMNILLEIIQQGTTNVKLHLETPYTSNNNINAAAYGGLRSVLENTKPIALLLVLSHGLILRNIVSCIL